MVVVVSRQILLASYKRNVVDAIDDPKVSLIKGGFRGIINVFGEPQANVVDAIDDPKVSLTKGRFRGIIDVFGSHKRT